MSQHNNQNRIPQQNTLGLNRSNLAPTVTPPSATRPNPDAMIPQLDEKAKFIGVRDLAQPNVRFQQGENLFDKSKKFVAKAKYGVNIPLKKKEIEVVDIEKVVTVRDRGPRANGSSVTKSLSVKELKARYGGGTVAKGPSTPEALLKANQENRRVAAAEANAL